ncbi:hypothetical protein [Corallococcus silvisoli]|uniref:hypothetical protein n=1 Tax=Corallococcus silvisoli TaxID=2697031 RepID=UPI001378F52E|nr:hypothetical protein [Corallococcus silvisoli]NBD12867.1 hypothetical protein [Corallococcus silvisoli]
MESAFSFDGNWEVLDGSRSADASPRYFFPGNTAAGQDGILVRVTPEGGGAPWLGVFAFGRFGQGEFSRVLSLPDPKKLCVVSRGAGYIVASQDPQNWEAIKSVPITDVRAVLSAGVVVFANLTEMVAYGAEGMRWRTKRLAWDGLKILEVTEHSIRGEYWDLREEATQPFEVDLATGAQKGGVEG